MGSKGERRIGGWMSGWKKLRKSSVEVDSRPEMMCVKASEPFGPHQSV